MKKKIEIKIFHLYKKKICNMKTKNFEASLKQFCLESDGLFKGEPWTQDLIFDNSLGNYADVWES